MCRRPGSTADTDFVLNVRINGGPVIQYLVSDNDDAEVLDIPLGATVQLSAAELRRCPPLPSGYTWADPVLVGPSGETAVDGILTFTVDSNATTTEIALVTLAPARVAASPRPVQPPSRCSRSRCPRCCSAAGPDSAPEANLATMVGGTVSERPKVQLSKSCVGESPPWVQIPPVPPRISPEFSGIRGSVGFRDASCPHFAHI